MLPCSASAEPTLAATIPATSTVANSSAASAALGPDVPQVGRHLLEGRRQQGVVARDPGIVLVARDRLVVPALPVLDPLREGRALAPRG